MSEPRPLSPREVTKRINAMVDMQLDAHVTGHFKKQMSERGLIMGDVLHVLKYGFVYNEGRPATQKGLLKYEIEGSSPNSSGRTLRLVVIPNWGHEIKLVTIMWADEPLARG